MWDLDEAIDHYRKMGAPGDQNAVIALLREMQAENGAIPMGYLQKAAQTLDVKEGFLLAFVKRIPSLRLSDNHVLELCGGPNCPKRANLAALVEKIWGKNPSGFAVRQVPCMRQCGKGPNIRWDGTLYNNADEALLRRLIDKE